MNVKVLDGSEEDVVWPTDKIEVEAEAQTELVNLSILIVQGSQIYF